jgi:hypothetical protein
LSRWEIDTLKQQVSPKVMIAVICAAVIIAAGVMVWVWRAPTVSVPPASEQSSAFAGPHHTPGEAREMAQGMRQEMLNRKQHLNGDNGQGAQTGSSTGQ